MKVLRSPVRLHKALNQREKFLRNKCAAAICCYTFESLLKSGQTAHRPQASIDQNQKSPAENSCYTFEGLVQETRALHLKGSDCTLSSMTIEKFPQTTPPIHLKVSRSPARLHTGHRPQSTIESKRNCRKFHLNPFEIFEGLPKSSQTAQSLQRQSKSSRRKLLLYIEGLAKSGQTADGPQSARIQKFLQKTPALHLKGQTIHSPQSTILIDKFMQITPAVHRGSS